MLETRLQMRLENGEPKCANCANWDVDKDNPAFGACLVLVKGIKAVAGDGLDFSTAGLASLVAMTTDLTVCSKWEAR
jgi:hypothetical protein